MTAFTRLSRPLLSAPRCRLGPSQAGPRLLSTTPLLRQSRESPSYPGLFYHPLDTSPTTSYQLSFLPSPAPDAAFSPTTIGTFSPPLEQLPKDGSLPELAPRGFVENDLFKDVMHTVLEEGVKNDPEFQTQAVVRGDGYIHIADLRKPSDPNRVPDPNDIIASVLVQNGAIYEGPEKGAYERGDLHRTVTMDGMMRLPEGLQLLLVEALQRVRAMEIEIVESQAKQ